MKTKASKSTIILSTICAVLTICLVASTFTIYKLGRINLFSKSINLDNNYFINDDETKNNKVKDDYFSIANTHAFSEKKADIAFGESLMNDRVLRLNSKMLIDVPYISQEGILPNGCEAVSATMLLRARGFDISPEDFVDNYLECRDVSIKFGCRFGPNPKQFYAGNPRSEDDGWGCFAPVIEKALNKYLNGVFCAKTLEGLSLENLKSLYIQYGIPVAVWVTVDMENLDKILQWQSSGGDETFLYPANEHCMAFVGYDSENYYFADPLNSNGVVKYSKTKADIAFNSLGRQAVVIEKTLKSE